MLLDLLIESGLGIHHVFEHAKVVDRVVLIERLNFLQDVHLVAHSFGVIYTLVKDRNVHILD